MLKIQPTDRQTSDTSFRENRNMLAFYFFLTRNHEKRYHGSGDQEGQKAHPSASSPDVDDELERAGENLIADDADSAAYGGRHNDDLAADPDLLAEGDIPIQAAPDGTFNNLTLHRNTSLPLQHVPLSQPQISLQQQTRVNESFTTRRWEGQPQTATYSVLHPQTSSYSSRLSPTTTDSTHQPLATTYSLQQLPPTTFSTQQSQTPTYSAQLFQSSSSGQVYGLYCDVDGLDGSVCSVKEEVPPSVQSEEDSDVKNHFLNDSVEVRDLLLRMRMHTLTQLRFECHINYPVKKNIY